MNTSFIYIYLRIKYNNIKYVQVRLAKSISPGISKKLYNHKINSADSRVLYKKMLSSLMTFCEMPVSITCIRR